MARRRHNAPPDLNLGPMPCDLIEKTLGIELDDGYIIFSSAAQLHAANRHPDDYAKCLPFAGKVAIEPLYMGDDFKNSGKIECVGRAPSLGSGVLVALSIEPDGNGNYHVCSIYPISHKKIGSRLEKNHLIHCK